MTTICTRAWQLSSWSLTELCLCYSVSIGPVDTNRGQLALLEAEHKALQKWQVSNKRQNAISLGRNSRNSMRGNNRILPFTQQCQRWKQLFVGFIHELSTAVQYRASLRKWVSSQLMSLSSVPWRVADYYEEVKKRVRSAPFLSGGDE